MRFLSSFRQGRDAAIAERGGVPRAPRDNAPPRVPPPPDGEASPVRIGYYYDREKDQVGEPNLFYGERHILIFGLNGAGKSTRFLIELLMTMTGRSIVVFDIKGELAFQTAAERRRFGDVKIVNPYGVLGLPSDGYNPLARLSPASELFYDDAAAIGDAMVEIESGAGQFWSESAQGFLVALVMWEVMEARRENRPPLLFNVRRLLTEADEYEPYTDADGKPRKRLIKGVKLTAARMVASGNSTLASLASRFVNEHGENTLAGIQQTAMTQTEYLLSAPMQADLCKSGTSFARLNQTSTTIYIVLPAGEISHKRRWTRVLVSSALRDHLQPGPVKTLFVLDEFRAAVGKLPVVSDVWSLVRGYGIQLMPIVQSALQLKELFKDEWENYAAQAGVIATIGPPGDLFTAEWMSKRCGVTTILQTGFNLGDGVNSGDGMNAGTGMTGSGSSSNQGYGRNYGRNSSGGLGFQQAERRAFLPQELMDMQPGHGRIWLPGMGSRSIPFFAPNYWKRRAPWVERVRPNPYRTG